MKTSKIFSAILVIFALSLLLGCSDQISSSGESGSGTIEHEKQIISQAVGKTVSGSIITTQIKLEPYESYTFNVSNTGFDQFNSIYVENLSIVHNDKVSSQCQNLFIYGNKLYECIILGCDNKGFEVYEITIENLTPKIFNLKVSLGGKKKRVAIPVDTE